VFAQPGSVVRDPGSEGCYALGWEAMYSATDLLLDFGIVLPQFAFADLILQAPRRILNL